MLFCKSCHVKIAGVHDKCPLCGSGLSGEPESAPSYPPPVPISSKTKRILQLISAAALVAAIVCVAVNTLIPSETWWSLFVVLSLFCGWLWAMVGILKKAKLINNIVWELVLISAVLFLFDGITGWRGWSVDYAFPSLCFAAMAAIIILSRVLHLADQEYMISLIFCAVLGLVPMVFVYTGVAAVPIVSVLCAAISLIILSLLLIFNWSAICREIRKKLHM